MIEIILPFYKGQTKSKKGILKIQPKNPEESSEDEDVGQAYKAVQFNPNASIKPPTLLRSIDFIDYDDDGNDNNDELDADENRIGKLETLEQVKKENEMLLQELNSLERKKRDGHDVTHEYKKLKSKIAILKEIKTIIVETEKMRAQTPNIGIFLFKFYILVILAYLIEYFGIFRSNKILIYLNYLKEKEAKEQVDHFKKLSQNQDKKLLNQGEMVKKEPKEPKKEIAEDIADYLMNQEFEICFCFDINFKFKFELFDLLKSIFNDETKLKCSISIIYWGSRFELKYSKFQRFTANFLLSKVLYETKSMFQDVRDEIINLNWSKHSPLKMYLYIETPFDTCDKMINHNFNDSTNKLISYKGIRHFYKYIFEASSLNRQELLFYLKKCLKSVSSNFIFNELIDLKRCVVDDSDSLLSFIKRNKFASICEADSNEGNKVLGEYQKIEYTKSDVFNVPKSINTNKNLRVHVINIRRSTRSSNFSRIKSVWAKCPNKFTCISYNSDEVIYLEKLNKPPPSKNGDDYSSNLYMTLIDIHLTSKFLALEFNKTLKPYEIEISNVYLLKRLKENESERSSLEFVKEKMKAFDERPSQLNSFEQNILDAFSHFTYKYTNNQLLVTSARTSMTGHSRCLLDEPVIFSTVKKYKFGSSDLGQRGIDFFFKSHICNSLCQYFY